MTATPKPRPDVVPLVDADDASTYGVKAARLAELLNAGFPVPDGVVLRVGGEPSTVPPLTTPMAVRSSALDEDLDVASFAGQFDSFLDVTPARLVQAIHGCRSSAHGERARAYRERTGVAGGAMGVLVQKMVPAKAAGVAFSADPITGRRDIARVNAVAGLGDVLVSGSRTPEEWLVDDGARRLGGPEKVIDGALAREIAELARSVEKYDGRPQDIEWAWDGHTLWLLQSRPITALPPEPIPVSFESPGAGRWEYEGAHMPRPVSPFMASFYGDICEEGATTAFRRFGAPIEAIRYGFVGGYVYMQIKGVGEPDEPGPEPPWWVLAVLTRVLPTLRERRRVAREAFEGGLHFQLTNNWYDRWRDEAWRDIAELRAEPLDTMDDQHLLDWLERARELLERGLSRHFDLMVPHMIGVSELDGFCREHLGWSTAKTMRLVTGLSEMSSRPSRRLHEVASGELSIDEWMDEFGYRALSYDPMEPTLGEVPQLIERQLDTLRNPERLAAEQRQLREEATSEARSMLSARRREEFESLLAFAERAFPMREDNSFPLESGPMGLIRLGALEVGRRIGLDEPGHFAFLKWDELREGLAGGVDVRERIRRRRGEYQYALHATPPESFGPEASPPPDLRALPRHMRRFMRALNYFLEGDLTRPAPDADGLRGVPASPGRHTGIARIVRSEHDLGRLRPGDVMICPITSPMWSPVFGTIGALVADHGGLLSHTSIVAREHGIPAVVATGCGTSVIRDGARVRVDGDTGTIEVLDEEGGSVPGR